MGAKQRCEKYLEGDCDHLLREISSGKVKVGKYASLGKSKKGEKKNATKQN